MPDHYFNLELIETNPMFKNNEIESLEKFTLKDEIEWILMLFARF